MLSKVAAEARGEAEALLQSLAADSRDEVAPNHGGRTTPMDELPWRAMGLSAEEILEHLRELPPSERRKVLARAAEEDDEAPSSEEGRELDRRIDLAEAGKSMPAREVLAMLRARA